MCPGESPGPPRLPGGHVRPGTGRAAFTDCPHDDADTVAKDHGRIEIRRCWTIGDPGCLAHVDPDREWCSLASLVGGEAELPLWTVRRHGVSKMPATDWIMDVALGEDDNRIRTGHAAHNLLRQDQSPG